MGVLDKFLDIMKLNDDYEDDDFYDDYEDDYDEKPSKKSNFFKKEKEYDEFEDEVDDFAEKKSQRSKPSSKVTPMRQSSRTNGMEVCVIKPTSVDDGREISETLLNNRTVILNLEGLDLEIAQRIIDFTSGATFAINGNLQMISNYIFLVTPLNVDITGDLQDLLGNSFDVSSVRNRF